MNEASSRDTTYQPADRSEVRQEPEANTTSQTHHTTTTTTYLCSRAAHDERYTTPKNNPPVPIEICTKQLG